MNTDAHESGWVGLSATSPVGIVGQELTGVFAHAAHLADDFAVFAIEEPDVIVGEVGFKSYRQTGNRGEISAGYALYIH